ncbi:MAG: hypothetical protein J6V53_02845 [Alphaproteobacteria bacterium]|nr:hypothetical protein [Alphaproteobacteria bacterium]
MKRKFFLGLTFFIYTAIGFNHPLHANFVEEKEISTKDGSCSIRYLTDKNIKGWYFDAKDITCSEDGWLDGYHDLTIKNAFSKPVEQLYGYFSYGYWTGSAFVKSPFLTRFTEENGDQKATFLLARDQSYQLDYIGQMIAKQDKMGSYGSFQVCNPFRLLIVTENIPVFADKKKLRSIFKEIEKQVRSICPAEEKVMLFVSPVIEPTQEDIVFYAEMDLKNNTQKVKWQEESLKQSGYYEKTVEAATLSNIVSPNTRDLDVLRKTIAKKIDLIPFKVKQDPQNVSFETQKKDISLEKEITPQTSFIKTATQNDDEDLLNQEENSFEEPQFLLPEPNKNYQHQNKVNEEDASPVMHLCILSKIKQENVPIQTVVHIQDNTYNESYTNSPLPLKIGGHALKAGWYQVTGSLRANQEDDIYYGTIFPSNIQNYEPTESESTK